jgi:S-adenosylmethionine hydrolase
VPLSFPEPAHAGGGLDTSVLYIDAFGNCRLAGVATDLARVRGSLEPGDRFVVRISQERAELPWATTFGAVGLGEAILYDDADYAGLAIGVNQGSAAQRFGLSHDDPVRIEPA